MLWGILYASGLTKTMNLYVHVCKGIPAPNATKIWITSNHNVLLGHNKSQISNHDLNKLYLYIIINIRTIEALWLQKFGNITYYA